jgi:UDP-N-acetylmuramoyl-tripeptide--D-alanyl-D-alanine ligase
MKTLLKNIVSSILLWESKIIIKKYKPIVIAVTGTVGKTSTKDAIFSVLSGVGYVRKSEKSYNSEIGIPLTIIGCPNGWNDPLVWMSNILEGLELIIFHANYPQCLVLEVGADHPGDISSVAKWLRSDVVIINKIGDVPVHVEFFPTPADVVKEKASLIKSLKENGTLVLFSDDIKVGMLAQGVNQPVITFGIDKMATVFASNISIIYDNEKLPEGMSFKLNYKGNAIPMKIFGSLGVQQIYPMLAAVAVGIARNVSIGKIIDSFEHHIASRGRMNIIKGINGSVIIDDSYNSSPDALREGLSTLASLQVSGKRIAVLGDMMELGNFSGEEHRKAGIQALQSCDVLVVVGPRAKLMSDKAISFNTSIEAGEYVKSVVSSGDVVFVKGSQSIRMERVSKVLLAEPEKASDLLVRQDKEWLAKK